MATLDNPLLRDFNYSLLLGDFNYNDLMGTVESVTNPASAGATAASEGLYTYVDNRTRGGAKDLLTGNTVRYLTADELQKEFNASDNDELQRAFGSFDNYLGYMDERQALINSGDINPEWWTDGQAGWNNMQATETALFDKWATNEGKDWSYAGGLQGYNQDGDSYAWNGSSFVKVGKVDDHAGFGDYLKMAAIVAGSIWAGPALAGALGGGTVGAAAAGGIVNAAGQLAMNGKVDFGDALKAAALAGLSTEAYNALTKAREGGSYLDQMSEYVNKLTGEEIGFIDPSGNFVTELPAGIDPVNVWQGNVDGWQTALKEGINLPSIDVGLAGGVASGIDTIFGTGSGGRGTPSGGEGVPSVVPPEIPEPSDPNSDKTQEGNTDEKTDATTTPQDTVQDTKPEDTVTGTGGDFTFGGDSGVSNDPNKVEDTVVPPSGITDQFPGQTTDPSYNDNQTQEDAVVPPQVTDTVADGSSGGGMLSGGDFTPQWGELFAYTPWSEVKGKAIAPYVDYIKQARGMLS